jgi:hypothetical protein
VALQGCPPRHLLECARRRARSGGCAPATGLLTKGADLVTLVYMPAQAI